VLAKELAKPKVRVSIVSVNSPLVRFTPAPATWVAQLARNRAHGPRCGALGNGQAKKGGDRGRYFISPAGTARHPRR
jgi:hypothetical protein